MTLFWQQFRAQLTGLLIWLLSGLVLVFALTRTAQGAVVGGVDLFAQLPEEMQRLIGLRPDLSAIDSYVAGKIAPSAVLVLLLYAAVVALSIVTRDVDRRTIDFLLSLPIGRRQVLLARSAVLAVNTGLMGAVLWGACIADLQSQGLLDGATGRYWLIFLGQWLLALAVGALTLLGSLWVDDYSLAIKLFLGLLSGLYFLEMGMKAAGVSRLARLFSPFSYADPAAILAEGRLPTTDLVLLVGVAFAALAASLAVFDRKQITA